MIYIVTIAGGRGDKVWDSTVAIEAKSIRDALDKAELQLDLSVEIISVELEP